MADEPKLLTNDELMALEFPRPHMLVERILPSSGHCLIHAATGVGKTAFALRLALDIVNGTRFLGRYNIISPGPVAYLQTDMPTHDHHQRMKMLQEYAGVDQIYHVVSDVPIDVVKLADKAHPPEWAEEIRELDPSILFVDSLRNIHTLPEWGEKADFKLVYACMAELVGHDRMKAYMHHNRQAEWVRNFKTNSWERNEMTMHNDERGMGIKDGIAIGFNLVDEKGVLKELSFSKGRWFRPEPDEEHIRMRVTEDMLVEVTSDRWKLNSYIKSAFEDGVPKSQIVAHVGQPGNFGNVTLAKSVVYEKLAALEANFPVGSK